MLLGTVTPPAIALGILSKQRGENKTKCKEVLYPLSKRNSE